MVTLLLNLLMSPTGLLGLAALFFFGKGKVQDFRLSRAEKVRADAEVMRSGLKKQREMAALPPDTVRERLRNKWSRRKN